jgi:hypothetical protein
MTEGTNRTDSQRGDRSSASLGTVSDPVMEAQGGSKMNLKPQTLDLGIDAALASDVSARAGSGKATTFFKDKQGGSSCPSKSPVRPRPGGEPGQSKTRDQGPRRNP